MKDNKFELKVNKYIMCFLWMSLIIGAITLIGFLSWMVYGFIKGLLCIMMLGISG